MVTGVDLVREQPRAAAGGGPETSPPDLPRHGHAMECRVNAEAPIRNFLPSPGRIVSYREPTGSGVRIDSGVTTGSVVPPYYDPLIAKLIVHTRNRGETIQRMRRSIDAYEIRGVQTNLPFHRELLRRREFVHGDLWTTMVADLRIAARLRSRGPWEERVAAIAAALVASGRVARGETFPLERPSVAKWALAERRERLAGGGPAGSARRGGGASRARERNRRRAMAWCVRSQSRKARRSPRTGSSRRSSCADRRRLEEMPKALLLRSEVANVRRRGRHLERDAFRYVDAVRAEFLDLRGVVRHQLNRCHAKHSEHARGTLVTPEVRGEAKDAICVDGVETVVLEVVRRDLVDDPDAPSLLGEVQQDAFRRASESPHCGIELFATVAPLRAEDIAGHAL